jgi:predicted nucleic acid-binding protein
VTPIYLIDKSAWQQRERNLAAAVVIEDLQLRHEVAVCEMVALEMLYSTRGLVDWDELRQQLATAYRWLPVTNDAMGRAIEVQGMLTARGHHRVSLPDLIIAATAELGAATVLHYDKDYDLIAAVTRQPTEWVVPRGSVG